MTISNHDDHEEHDVTSYFLVNFVVTFVSLWLFRWKP
jgi:hypothetical protein